MSLTLPGTTIEVSTYQHDTANRVLTNIFAMGGIVLSQICTMTGLEAHTVQNWVKRGFLSPPIHRQYSRRQFARVVMINMLRECMQIDHVVRLLSYVNGVLSREDDDSIDDSLLYGCFVNLVGQLEGEMPTREALGEACDAVLEDFIETIPDSKRRIRHVLLVMVYAFLSYRTKQQAELLLREVL